jgi:hypothetical protein
VEGEDARTDPVASTASEIDIGRPIEELCPRSTAGTQARNFVRQVFGDGAGGIFIAETRQHIADQIAGRRDLWCDTSEVGEAAIGDFQRLTQQTALQVLALRTGQRSSQHCLVDAGDVAHLLDECGDDTSPITENACDRRKGSCRGNKKSEIGRLPISPFWG